MRTTIEIDDEVRAELVRLAADRGERGYSTLVNELLRRHLGLAPRKRTPEEFAKVLEQVSGSISDEEADVLLESIRESRRNWRER
jgi:predicted CopG family antitoxin